MSGKGGKRRSSVNFAGYQLNGIYAPGEEPLFENVGTSIIFKLPNGPGTLASALKCLEGIDLMHIESKPDNRGSFEFYAETATLPDDDDFKEAVSKLKKFTGLDVRIMTQGDSDDNVPWFPQHIAELDRFANQILSYGSELDSDHPGFTDEVYRARRKEFADIAFTYRHHQRIPRVSYTPAEIATWREVYDKLTVLFKKSACREFNNVFPLLEKYCGYSRDNIPQLQDISDFLAKTTGFRLRPVAGLLSSRDFLAGLAFRVFHSTQYIRHSSKPLYTPEPDCCHELLGHVPLFADPKFAEFSQEIGLASLGASDEDVKRLATLYWFTVEFGVCRQEGELKIYGAGILSSFGEMEYALSGEPELLPFDPAVTCETEYPITTYQPKYFVTESFEDAKLKLKDFAKTIKKPVDVRYNAYNQCIEVLDSMDDVHDIASDLRTQINNLSLALQRIQVP